MTVVLYRVAKKPWKTLKKPGFCLPLEKYSGKILKSHPTPEKLCSEANFPCINFWSCSAVAFFIPVMQGRFMRLLGVETAHHLSYSKQPHFPSTDTKFQVKRKMKGGWVQAEDLCDNYVS